MSFRAKVKILGTVVFAALCLGAPLAGASAQEPEIPVMVQTVPSLQGVELSLDGHSFFSDENGLALTTVEQPGTYQLQISTSEAADGVRRSFVSWSDGRSSAARNVTVDSFTVLEAGFDTSYATAVAIVSANGSPAEGDVGIVSLRDDRGREVSLKAGFETWLPAERIVAGSGGLSSQAVEYEVEAIDGSPVPASESETFRPNAGGTVALEIDEPVASVAGPQEAPGDRAESASDEGLEPWIPLLQMLLVAAFVIVVLRSGFSDVLSRLQAPGLGAAMGGAASATSRRLVGLRIPLEGIGFSGLGAALDRLKGATEKRPQRRARLPGRLHTPRLGAARDRLKNAIPRRRRRARGTRHIRGTRRRSRVRERSRTHVRVMLKDGRLIEGFRDARPAASTDEFFCLIDVTRVLDENSQEVQSAPMDSFIPVTRIARVEAVGDSVPPAFTVDLRANGRTHASNR